MKRNIMKISNVKKCKNKGRRNLRLKLIGDFRKEDNFENFKTVYRYRVNPCVSLWSDLVGKRRQARTFNGGCISCKGGH